MTKTRVRFGETDAAGIVFYPTFFAWFDLGTTGLIRAAARGDLCNPDGSPRHAVPIVESGATFLSPLRFDDEIEIRSTVTAVGTTSLRVEHVVTCGAVECARGFEVRVYIERRGATIAGVPIPQELRASLTEGASSEEVA